MAIIVLPISQYTNAQQVQAQYKDWAVYTVNQEGQKLCYIISFPKSKSGNYRYRSEPYVMITNIDGRRDEFSVTAGYKYKKRTKPRAIIDGKEYKLSFTSGEIAWFKTNIYDRKAIEKMKKGMKLKIKGTSIKGTYSIDTYSLRGFTKAYKKMKKLCKKQNERNI